MFKVFYYMNGSSHQYAFIFESLWAATFKARAIFEEHGFATDVMNAETGEILAIFGGDTCWTAESVSPDVCHLATQPLK